MSLSPIRILTQSDPALLQVLKLIQESFIFMIGRIDPPSSVRSLTLQDLTEKAQTDWILGVGDPVEACVVASPRHNALYLGKMAVHPSMRGQGMARALVQACEGIAVDLGLGWLELQVRVELVENQNAFAKMGFLKTTENFCSGYDHVTEITMQKNLYNS